MKKAKEKPAPDHIAQAAALVAEIKADFGVPQAWIARRLGVGSGTLSKWLTRKVKCRHPQMLMLALRWIRNKDIGAD